MEVCGFDTDWEMLNGVYRREPTMHHRKPVYKKRGGEEGIDTYIYFWDDPGESLMTGWWISPSVGGDDGFAISKAGNNRGIPPSCGWKVLETGDGEGNGSKSSISVVPISLDSKHSDNYIPRSRDCRRNDEPNNSVGGKTDDGDSQISSKAQCNFRVARRINRSRSPRANRSPSRPIREISPRHSGRSRSRSPAKKGFSVLRPIVLGRNATAHRDQPAKGRNPATRSKEEETEGKGSGHRGLQSETESEQNRRRKPSCVVSRSPERIPKGNLRGRNSPEPDGKGLAARLVPRGVSPASTGKPRREGWTVRDIAAPKSSSSHPGSKSGKGASKGNTIGQSEARSDRRWGSEEDSDVGNSEKNVGLAKATDQREANRGPREIPMKFTSNAGAVRSMLPGKRNIGILPGSMGASAFAKAPEASARTRVKKSETHEETIERLQHELETVRSEKSKVFLERLDNESLCRKQMVDDLANFVVSVEKREAGGVINEDCAWQLMEKWQSNDGSLLFGTFSAAIMRAITRAKSSLEKRGK